MRKNELQQESVMFLVITKDTVLFNAITFLLNKSQVVHVQDEDDIDLVLHQHCHIIIDTLMNNVFHSAMAEKIKQLRPEQVIVFSPFIIKRCLGDIPVTFVLRNISLIDFMVLVNRGLCPAPEADIMLSRKQHQVLSYIAQQMQTEDILQKMQISLKTFYCHKHSVMMILNLRRITELIKYPHVSYLI
ncbi:Putative HTH-type transcriptional regulator dctR, Probable repressor of dctA dicarboxylate transporter gene [Escherichia fergusonii ATCC 35469]|uniref:HTH-type transcriptional regulator dctR, Probable repressor of dctA dicarboxylate transporter protein n=2 Tax=Escherichia fergusonii TaxID=564 RepID=B7LQG5_ESCF3|nr:Putative HTH-type transcriptional regulator dctR, Probable repressor of dctA dicarboxylate transporter gene [Escherichia fergusonii ATCC 35469]